MKRIFTLLAICLALASFSQQCHRATWVKTYGNQQFGENIIDVESNPQGDFIILGQFPMQGITLGTASLPAGDGGYFLGRVDSSGSYSNLVEILPLSYVTAKRITVLNDGSVAVACNLLGNVTLGNETYDVHGGARALLVKFDNQFNYLWHLDSENSNNAVDTRDIASDSEGNIFWGGNFTGDYFVIEGQWMYENNGKAWLSKVNGNGQLQWLRQLGSTVAAGVQTVSVDSDDNVWITGQTSLNTINVFKFSDQLVYNGFLNNAYSLYVGKYNSTGDCIWGQLSTTNSNSQGFYTWDAKGDENGNMYMCGKVTTTHYLGGATIDGGDGSGFLLRMTENGTVQWVKTMGGQNSGEEATRIDYRDGRIAVIGSMFSNQPFIGDFPVHATQTGSSDSFNAMFFADGSLEFARTYDSDFGNHYLSDVMIDEGGNQLMFGQFKGAQTWYPISLNQSGSVVKLYIAKFSAAGNVPFTISAGPDKNGNCGVNIQLSGSTTPTNGVDFGWFPNLGFFGNATKTPTIQVTTPGSYIFYGYYQGCVVSDTVNVILDNYDITVDIDESVNYCIGDTANMVATANQPDATFAWTPNYRVTNTTAANTGIYSNADMNYVLEATYNGCKARDTVAIMVNPLPFIYVPYSQFYQGLYQHHQCLGEELNIDLGLPQYEYTVTPDSNIIWLSSHEINVETDEGNLYMAITAESGAGCSSTIPFGVYPHDYQSPPPALLEQPTDTIYFCPGSGFIGEETFLLTTSVANPSDFQYGWYPGWQVDELNGEGWRDIEYWEFGHYLNFPFSVGDGNSAYYAQLEFYNVHTWQDGFKFRAWVRDICSERLYSEEMVLRVGPAIESQSLEVNICEGASETLFVQSTSNTSSYQWEVFSDGNWEVIVDGTDGYTIDDNFLTIADAYIGMDSLFRCRTAGCAPELYMYSDDIVVNVQANDLQAVQPFAEAVCPLNDGLITLPLPVGNFTLQWYADDVMIVDNATFEGANNDSLFIYSITEELAQATYKCSITSEQCGQDVLSEIISISLSDYTPVFWENEIDGICADGSSIELSEAIPADGVYSGAGVEDNQFDPSLAEVGENVLTYSYFHPVSGCQSYATQTIEVFALPMVALHLNDDVLCTNEEAVTLTGGTPEQGSFSGEFVEENTGEFQFEIEFAFEGGHEIIYSFTDENGCTAEAIDSIYVISATPITWIDDLGYICIGDNSIAVEVPIPSGGVYQGVEITDGFVNSEQLPAGDYEITYSYTNQGGCTSEAFSWIHFQGIDAIWSWGDTAFCQNGNVPTLNGGFPVGGVYTGEGVEGNVFDQTLLSEGIYVLTYTYTDELSLCQDSESINVYVAATPVINWTEDFGAYCMGDSSLFITTATPAGGEYSGGDIIDGYLQFESLGVGQHELNYTYSSENGCYTEVSSTISIFTDPEVQWIPANGNDFGVCVNLETSIDLTPYVSLQGGTFSSIDVQIENNVWVGLPSFEAGFANIAYGYTDPNSGCTVFTEQIFEMVVCFGIEELTAQPKAYMQNGNELHIAHTQPLEIVLMNASGQLIMHVQMTDTNQVWKLDIANGAYVVKMNDGASTWLEQIIVID